MAYSPKRQARQASVIGDALHESPLEFDANPVGSVAFGGRASSCVFYLGLNRQHATVLSDDVEWTHAGVALFHRRQRIHAGVWIDAQCEPCAWIALLTGRLRRLCGGELHRLVDHGTGGGIPCGGYRRTTHAMVDSSSHAGSGVAANDGDDWALHRDR